MHLSLEPTQRTVLRALLRRGPSSRRSLASATYLDPTTIARAITSLRRRELVVDVPARADGPKARGRPPTLVGLQADSSAAIGIRLGLTKADLGLIDLHGNVLRGQSVTLRPQPKQGLEHVIEAASELAIEARASGRQLMAAGIAAAGAVDAERGSVRMQLEKSDDRRVDVAGPVAKAIGAFVQVETLGRAMAIGETFFGVERDPRSLALLYVGRVVRLGLVREGELQLTEGEYVGMGHAVLDPVGPTCYCGQHGCFEVYTSVARMETETRRLALEAPRSILANALAANPEDPLRALSTALRDDDPLSARLLENWARWLARGLVIILHAFQPTKVMLAGPEPLVEADALSLIAREVERISPRFGSVPVHASSIPFPEIAVLGAAGLAVDRMLGDSPRRPLPPALTFPT